MLHVLKLAAESYLGTTIHKASIALPFPIEDSSREHLRAGCPALALQRRTHRAAEVATWVYHIPKGGLCPSDTPDDWEELVLGVDLNEETLALSLFTVDQEYGVVDLLRIMHSIDLGAQQSFGTERWRETFVGEVYDMIALPFGDGIWRDKKVIDQLVIARRLRAGCEDRRRAQRSTPWSDRCAKCVLEPRYDILSLLLHGSGVTMMRNCASIYS